MGRDSGHRKSGLQPALSRRTAGLRYFRAELRAGWRHRFLWPPLRTATRPQRPPNLFLWGPRGYSGNCLIVLDDSREVLEREFEHVEYVGKSSDNPYAIEREIPVFICRGAKFGSLAGIWPRLKRWR